SLVSALTEKLVDVLVAVTETPGATALVLSVTTPEIDARPACPSSPETQESARSAIATTPGRIPLKRPKDIWTPPSLAAIVVFPRQRVKGLPSCTLGFPVLAPGTTRFITARVESPFRGACGWQAE